MKQSMTAGAVGFPLRTLAAATMFLGLMLGIVSARADTNPSRAQSLNLAQIANVAEWRVYRDAEYGFSVRYPARLTPQAEPTQFSAVVIGAGTDWPATIAHAYEARLKELWSAGATVTARAARDNFRGLARSYFTIEGQWSDGLLYYECHALVRRYGRDVFVGFRLRYPEVEATEFTRNRDAILGGFLNSLATEPTG